MKRWKSCSLFFLLLISGVLLTGAGYAGENSIYADYSRQNGWMTPAFSLVFQGLKDGIGPWELLAAPTQTLAKPDQAETAVWEEADLAGKETTADRNTADREIPAAEGENAAMEDPSGHADPSEPDGNGTQAREGLSANGQDGVSRNGLPGTGTSGTGVSENDVSGTGVSENGVSGNTVSGNNVSENRLPGNGSPQNGDSPDTAFTMSDGSRYDRFGQLILPDAGKDASVPSPEEPAGTTEEAGTEASREETAPPQEAEASREETAPPQEPEASREPTPARETAPVQETSPAKEEKTFVQVQESYFDDALFIGDSRTVGLDEYGGFQESTVFFAKTSLTIYDLFEEPEKFAHLSNGKKATLEEALTERRFGKIYIMLGINELGKGTTESFFRVYAEAVNRIRLLQPDALIFIQGIMRVGEEKNDTDEVFNNTNINGRNQAISLMADNRSIFYLEVNDAVCDENGNLISDYTFDQIHLKAKYYQLWKDYLFAHGI